MEGELIQTLRISNNMIMSTKSGLPTKPLKGLLTNIEEMVPIVFLQQKVEKHSKEFMTQLFRKHKADVRPMEAVEFIFVICSKSESQQICTIYSYVDGCIIRLTWDFKSLE